MPEFFEGMNYGYSNNFQLIKCIYSETTYEVSFFSFKWLVLNRSFRAAFIESIKFSIQFAWTFQQPFAIKFSCRHPRARHNWRERNINQFKLAWFIYWTINWLETEKIQCALLSVPESASINISFRLTSRIWEIICVYKGVYIDLNIFAVHWTR